MPNVTLNVRSGADHPPQRIAMTSQKTPNQTSSEVSKGRAPSVAQRAGRSIALLVALCPQFKFSSRMPASLTPITSVNPIELARNCSVKTPCSFRVGKPPRYQAWPISLPAGSSLTRSTLYGLIGFVCGGGIANRGASPAERRLKIQSWHPRLSAAPTFLNALLFS